MSALPPWPGRALRFLFRRALTIFFRQIDVEGLDRVPGAGPVVFVANHPNGLVDALLLLCFAPRPVSFLAKAPLFRMPLVGPFIRAFGSIPVYRRQDAGTDPARNRETFEAAHRLLGSGGALGLFPEGASHDEPELLPLRTGAARIVLGAAAHRSASVFLVPTGLFYTWKQRFRSSALVLFGGAIEVPAAPPAHDDGEPPADAVRELTARIATALESLTLHAETRDALRLARLADRIFASGDLPEALADQLARRRRFVEGHRRLAARDPARLASLEERIAQFDTERRAAGLALHDLSPEGLGARGALLLASNAGILLLAPVAAAGALVHYPAYRLAGVFARRIARGDEDIASTAKLGVSLLLFPATWIAGALLAGRALGVPAGIAALALLPASGWAALRFAEAFNAVVGRMRALGVLLLSRSAVERLLAEREAIRREILALAEELELAGAGD